MLTSSTGGSRLVCAGRGRCDGAGRRNTRAGRRDAQAGGRVLRRARRGAPGRQAGVAAASARGRRPATSARSGPPRRASADHQGRAIRRQRTDAEGRNQVPGSSRPARPRHAAARPRRRMRTRLAVLHGPPPDRPRPHARRVPRLIRARRAKGVRRRARRARGRGPPPGRPPLRRDRIGSGRSGSARRSPTRTGPRSRGLAHIIYAPCYRAPSGPDRAAGHREVRPRSGACPPPRQADGTGRGSGSALSEGERRSRRQDRRAPPVCPLAPCRLARGAARGAHEAVGPAGRAAVAGAAALEARAAGKHWLGARGAEPSPPRRRALLSGVRCAEGDRSKDGPCPVEHLARRSGALVLALQTESADGAVARRRDHDARG